MLKSPSNFFQFILFDTQTIMMVCHQKIETEKTMECYATHWEENYCAGKSYYYFLHGCYQKFNQISGVLVSNSIAINVNVKLHFKDVNPFNNILVGAWDSRKINHLNK